MRCSCGWVARGGRTGCQRRRFWPLRCGRTAPGGVGGMGVALGYNRKGFFKMNFLDSIFMDFVY